MTMRCNPDLLWTLIEQPNEPGSEADQLLQHIGTCSLCQDELHRIAGENRWWIDSSRYLSEHTESSESDSKDTAPNHTPNVDLSFLAAARHPELLGRIGRYDVEGFLGQGGMGIVLRGFDTDLQRTVAIKVLAPQWASNTDARERFSREAQAAASIAHENVVPIYHVHTQDNPPFLVMRYIPGMTLERFVKSQEKLSPSAILRIASQLCDGLGAAHAQGLIHRDVKAGNVLIGDNVERVWLTDFGLARAADATTLTHTGVISGTPHYMSPEQARGQPLDFRSDLFSLGAVFFFMSTGRTPFEAENTLAVLNQVISAKPMSLKKLRPDLPPSFVHVVDQLLCKHRHARPSSTEEVRRTLRLANEELENPRMVISRRFRRLSLLLMALVLALGTTAWLVRFKDQSNVNAQQQRFTYSSNSESVAIARQTLPDVEPIYLQLAARIDRDVPSDQALDKEFKRIEQQLRVLETKFGYPIAAPRFTEFHTWDREAEEIRNQIKSE